MFGLKSKIRLATGIVRHANPLYVQFYITARCNLTCQQCNIIFANSDMRECTLPEIEKIADNLGKIGVAVVLLTGGEPFVRQDLPEIIRAFHRNGLHVRMQTNGFANEDIVARCVEYGARDISISLDSLRPELQNSINGGFSGSWDRAIDTIAMVTRHLPPQESFAALGCVLCPHNIEDVEEVVRLGSAIGWFTSLVPVHVTDESRPMNFRTTDRTLAFQPEHHARIDALLERLRGSKEAGELFYDAEEYLADIGRFVRHEPIQWRRRNGQICDSPALYFAILPNGDFAVCCDHRLSGQRVSTYAPEFPEIYRDRDFQSRVVEVAAACEGCLFGSFPEITISARYWQAMWERARIFLAKPPRRRWPVSSAQLHELVHTIRAQRLDASAAGRSPTPLARR